MAGYFIASYDISDADGYARYNPGALPQIMETVTRHGGKVLVAGPGPSWIAGERGQLVVIEFPSVDDAQAWLDDPDYKEVKAIRLASTTNRFEVVAPTFTPPG